MHQVKQSPWGYGYVRFENNDEGSCGTARVRRGDDEPVDLDGPRTCRVWEAMPLEGDGAIWSEVPDPEQIEVAEVFIREDGGEQQSLGYGTTGSLTWCGDALWFLRQMESTLMRWTPGKGLETAYRIDMEVDPEKVSVLSTPICAGDAISISELIAAPGHGNREILQVARIAGDS